ncbi:MAG: DNA recombination protein RmuC [Alphaproteobacteria bacterium]
MNLALDLPSFFLGFFLSSLGFLALLRFLSSRSRSKLKTATSIAVDAQHQLETIRQQLQEKEMRLQILDVHFKKNQEQFEERLAFLSTSQESLEKHLKALCGDALQANNQSFLTLAQTVLENFQTSTKGAWSHHHHEITQLLTPLSHALQQVDTKIQALEKARVGAYEGLQAQIYNLIQSQQDLHGQTSQLTQALKSPQTRGLWGEIQLKRVVEMAGMLPYCDFREQVCLSDEMDKRQRPDLIVNLPGKRRVIIDAKVPLTAYLEALDTKDPNIRTEKMKEHGKQLRLHMKKLSAKAYWEHLQPSPEFVLLFLPSEVFLGPALEHDPGLLEYGFESNVMLATPTTLITLLRSIAFGWREEKLAKNAEAIRELGKELYKRLQDMLQHFSNVGRHLQATTHAYNQAVGSFESRVLPAARRFQELGAVSQKNNLLSISPLDLEPRKVTHSS